MEIEFKNCDICIYENLILKSVHLKIEEGKFYRFIGENGSGKTVLMNSLLGLNKHVIGDKNVMYEKDKVCYISETAFFFDDDKVTDVLKDICFFYNTNKNKLEDILKQMSINMDDLVSKKIFELSKGMRKKMMILPLFLDNCEILFLDEVFTGLDKKTQDLLVKELIHKNELGNTIVFIEHNESIVNQLIKNNTKMEVFECKNNELKKVL